MALPDLTPRDFARLMTGFSEVAKRRSSLPSLEELVPELRKAIGAEGDFIENLVPVFGEPIRSAFDLLKSVIAEKHGAEYADDLWARFRKKEQG